MLTVHLCIYLLQKLFFNRSGILAISKGMMKV